MLIGKRKKYQSRRQNLREKSVGQVGRATKFFKRLAWLILLICIIASLAWILSRPPNSITCYTNQNTYCSDTLEPYLEQIKSKPLILLNYQLKKNMTEIINQESQIVNITGNWQPLWNYEVQVEYAQPLFIASTRNKTWTIFSAGTKKENTEQSVFKIFFESETKIDQLSKNEREKLTRFYQLSQDLPIKPTYFEFKSADQVELVLENGLRILLSVTDNSDPELQVATLQSFLRSSTMNQESVILDVRFDGLAIVKE